jgi:hypothetical protein
MHSTLGFVALLIFLTTKHILRRMLPFSFGSINARKQSAYRDRYNRASFLSLSSSDILKKEMFNPETWHYPEKYYLCNSLHQTSCVLNLACRDPINVLKIFVLEKRLGNEAKLLINAAIWFLCSIFFFLGRPAY